MGYNSKDIKVLKGLDPVKQRPGMFIGNTDDKTGTHQTAFEIIDNAIDEAMNGYASLVSVVIHADGSLSVQDNGRGIPVEMHPIEKKYGVDLVFTVLHAGGKFDERAYKTSGGLHGVGASVVNALSEWLKVEIKRDGKKYFREYVSGNPVGDLKELGPSKKTGTIVTFKPNPKVFKHPEFDFDILKARLEELGFLNEGVAIKLVDERTGAQFEVGQNDGLKKFIERIEPNATVLTSLIQLSNAKTEKVRVRCAMQWKLGFDGDRVLAFTNNIRNGDGGTHVMGFKNVLTRCITKALVGKKNATLVTGDDIREGLVAIIDVKMSDPKFSSQVKSKLVSDEARTALENMSEAFEDYFEKNPTELNRVTQNALRAAEAREAARKARDLSRKKSAVEVGVLPGKLADCQSKDPTQNELFLVEGDSAGGTSRQGRDRKFQAVLPLRGKVINAEKATLHRLLANEEIKSLISAIGTGIGEGFDIKRLRYNKIFIMTDADSVTGDTPLMVYNKVSKEFQLYRTDEFIDKICDDVTKYQIISCDLKRKRFSLRDLKQVYKHRSKKLLFRITDDNGHHVDVSADHSVFVYRKETRSFEAIPTIKLAVGDQLISAKYIPNVESSEMKINPYFLGLYFGHGKLEQTKFTLLRSTKFKQKQEDIESLPITKLVEADEAAQTEIFEFTNKRLALSLEEMGVVDKSIVPNCLYSAPTVQKLAFIRGLFESCAVIMPNRGIYFYTDEALVTGLIYLLRQLGTAPKLLTGGTKALINIKPRDMKALYEAWDHHCLAKDFSELEVSTKAYELVKIKSIVELPAQQYVYDLSVDMDENFVAGTGGTLLHNTDGAHIKTLLLTFFYRYMPELVRRGHIYAAQPPLYRCVVHGKIHYILNDAELRLFKIKEKYGVLKAYKKNKKYDFPQEKLFEMPKGILLYSEKLKYDVPIEEVLLASETKDDFKMQRFKGLGEMTAEQLAETTLNPKTRKALQMKVDKEDEADKIITMLMGDDAEARRGFISENCQFATPDV